MRRGAYRPRTTDEQAARILKLKRQGLTTATIRRRLNLPYWTVDKVIREERKKQNGKGIRGKQRMP